MRSALFVLACCSVCWAGGPDVASQKLLPPDTALPGWKTVAGSDVSVTGDGLQQLYDGGFEVWTNAGVLGASQRMYRAADKSYLTLVVHSMRDSKAAATFLEYWRKQQKAPAATPLASGKVFVFSEAGATNGYWAGKSVYATASVNRQTAAARKAVNEALKAVASRIR